MFKVIQSIVNTFHNVLYCLQCFLWICSVCLLRNCIVFSIWREWGVVNIYLSVFYMPPFLIFNSVMLSQKSEKKPDLKMNMTFCCGKVRSTKRSIILSQFPYYVAQIFPSILSQVYLTSFTYWFLHQSDLHPCGEITISFSIASSGKKSICYNPWCTHRPLSESGNWAFTFTWAFTALPPMDLYSL